MWKAIEKQNAGAEPVRESRAASAANKTGIPMPVKSYFEAASGLSFDDVRVHYNSSAPKRVDALAYTQGNQVYLGPGQERHLSHELGHVMQQKRGMVRSTGRVAGLALNDDPGMERMADQIGTHATVIPASAPAVVQRAPDLGQVALTRFYQATNGAAGLNAALTAHNAAYFLNAGLPLALIAEIPAVHDAGDGVSVSGRTRYKHSIAPQLQKSPAFSTRSSFSVMPSGACPIQRRIFSKDGRQYPFTWKETPEELKREAESFYDALRNNRAVRNAWNKAAQNKNEEYRLNIPREVDALKDLLALAERSSRQSARNYAARDVAVREFYNGMNETGRYVLLPGARNPRITTPVINKVAYSDSRHPMRAQTHLATVLLSRYPNGVEFQVSFRRQGDGLIVSSNQESINRQVAGLFAEGNAVEVIRKIALDTAKRHARIAAASSPDSLMANRVVRHALKLYMRIANLLVAEAQMIVANEREQIKGTHAEIRIIKMTQWNKRDYFTPTGTKYPCMTCYQEMRRRDIDVEPCVSAFWVTAAALSQQLLRMKRMPLNLSAMTKKNAREAGRYMARQNKKYELPQTAQGIFRDGASGDQHDADSESDVDIGILFDESQNDTYPMTQPGDGHLLPLSMAGCARLPSSQIGPSKRLR